MITMKNRVLWTFACCLCLLMAAEQATGQDQNRVPPDTLKVNPYPAGEIVLSPVADPSAFYDPYAEMYRVQNGLFTGGGFTGAETSYRHPGSDYVLSLMAGGMDPHLIAGGLTIYREWALAQSGSDRDHPRTELYLRAGPGIGVAGRGLFTSRDMQTWLGLQSSAILGGQVRLGERSALYLHGGARMMWFPTLEEHRFHAAPVISLGIQFSTSPSPAPVRF